MVPQYGRAERTADAVVHGVGVTFGLAACVALAAVAVPQADAPLLVGVGLYAAGLMSMLGCSALYHLTGDGARKDVFRRLDHAAIFAMIAGTYTPFALISIGGAWGAGLFASVWLAAAGGVALKLLHPRPFGRLSIAAYLLLGWTVLVALDPLLAAVAPPSIALLATGGLLYSLGVLFHVWRRLPYHKVIWHVCVLAAAVCHYAAVLGEVAAAG